jgi:ABC-type Mn2+/Zn2+ transport system ATPase subunit
MSSSALRAGGLVIGWNGHPAVAGIDLVVPPGSSLAVVGTNGSGKSTFVRTVVGLLGVIDGRLEVLGEAPGTKPARVAYLGQFHPREFVLPVRVRDVVAMGRFASRGLLGRVRPGERALIDSAMERMQISDLAERPLRALSGGQQQRVYVAQVLAAQADLVVLDEPAAGLDVGAQQLLRQVISDECARGAAVILATHDIRDAAAADLAMLLAGRVVACGPAATTLTREAVLETFGLVLGDLPSADVGCADHDHGHGAYQPPVRFPRRGPTERAR